MERVKQEWLESQVRQLNVIAGFNATPKYSTIGSYTLDGAYGGWQLQQYCNESGGVSVISKGGYISKRGLYYQLTAMLEFATSMKDN